MFHPIYDRVRVISDQEEIPTPLAAARLRFYKAAKVVFARLLKLMGMSAPETMERRTKPEPSAEPEGA